MDNVIERLIDGQFEYERGILEFSASRVEITLRSGDMVEGTFSIFGPEDKAVEGSVSSTEIRMEVLTPSFSGSREEIGYRFRAEGLSSGDVIKGDFRIISNRGEYLLPFVVTVELEHVESTMGEIRNLFHFANLAKTDWNEALNLFYSDDFELILNGHDAQYRSALRGLRAAPRSSQSLEEFLLAVHKKQLVSFLPDKTEITLDHPHALSEEILTIIRNGWGYTSLDITTDGDFLITDKKQITGEDFIGNTCRFRFRIDPSLLHAGHNTGAIVFSNAYLSFKVLVKVHMHSARAVTEDYLQKKRLIIELMKLYASFRMHKIAANTWLQQAGELTGKLRTADPDDPVLVLYQAHFLITASRAAEGERLLNEWRPLLTRTDTGDALRCYYLYLTSLLTDDERMLLTVSRQIRDAWFGNPADWRIAWLMQFVSGEYENNASKKWELLKEQYVRGARSRIIYIEALLLCASHPAVLMRLDAFEVAMLKLAVREQMLPAQLIDRIVYLARNSKRYDADVFLALAASYNMKAQDETLTEICSMLIKGARTDEEAHAWYAKGVERSLRLTRLYEYFMMSVPLDEKGAAAVALPRPVLMYFSHGSDLDYRANAVLYRYVYETRDSAGEYYASYEPRIREFVSRQISKGRIDETLAYLYKKFLDADMVNAENAHTVLKVLHSCRIRVSHPDITEVVLIYDKLLQERRFPVTNGEVCLPLYGGEYCIVLADRTGNRFVDGISFDTDKLMIPGRLTQLVTPYIRDGEDYIDLFLCEMGGGVYTIQMENAAGYRMLASSDVLEMECRREIRQQLIRFYHDNDFTRQLAEALQEEDPSDMPVKKRNEVLELMVLFDNTERALNWMKRFGTYGIDPKIIMRMCARLPESAAGGTDPLVVEIIHYAFRKGRFDNTVLEYLIRAFQGTTREMRDIWKAAQSFGLDVYALSARMLYQMLYSGAYVGERMDIFRAYVQQGPDADLETAFLGQCAYDHFVRETVTGDFIYRRIGRMLAADVRLPDVCGMDYLKYFAGRRTGEFDIEIAEKALGRMIKRNLCFPFFADYADVLKRTGRYAERIMLQYRTKPGRRVVVHYMLHTEETGKEEQPVYTTRRMQEMYDSIYVMSFLLFFGEELQYYITENGPGDGREEETEQLTESGTLSRSDITQPQTEAGRFSMINDLCVAKTLKDYETFDRLAQEYFHTKYLTEQLFKTREDEDAAE